MRLIQHLHPTIKQTFLLAVIPAISFNAMAGEKVDKTLTTSASPIVEIEHVAGKATITGWDKNEVKVTGELGDRTEAFIFEKKGDDVILKVETNHRKIDWRDKNPGDGDDLTIFVPAKFDLSYTAVVADVEASRLTNSVQFDVVNGDITASLTLAEKGDVDASSVGGTLHLKMQKGVSARVEMQAHAGGDIVNRLTADKPSSAKYGPMNGWNSRQTGAEPQ